MAAAKLDRAIRTVYFTRDSLMSPGDFKLSRTKVACRVADGSLTTFSPADVKEGHQVVFAGLEQDLAALFAEVLGKDVAEIGRDSHFFRDLGGTSMDYYALMGLVRDRLGARVDTGDAAGPVTVAEFHDYLTK